MALLRRVGAARSVLGALLVGYYEDDRVDDEAVLIDQPGLDERSSEPDAALREQALQQGVVLGQLHRDAVADEAARLRAAGRGVEGAVAEEVADDEARRRDNQPLQRTGDAVE